MSRTPRDMFLDYANDVRAYLAVHVPESELDDAVSDVFTHAIMHFDLLRPPERDFLLEHAVTVARTYHHQHTQGPIPSGHQVGNQQTWTDPIHTLLDLRSALDGLDHDDRDALALAALGLDSIEASAILRVNASAYRVRLHRARTRLRRTLTEQGAWEQESPA